MKKDMTATNEPEKPQMWDWYTQYYAVVASSQANAQFCERLHGHNLCQHDFTEMAHLDKLIEVADLRPGQRVLDLGCGNGLIAEYLSDRSDAHVTGIDFIPEAIRQAQERTRSKRDRLEFRVGNIGAPDFPDASFDLLVSIDTLYFTPLPETIGRMKQILKPDGQMAMFYSHGCLPHESLETFPKEKILPDGTPLAQALQQQRCRPKT